MHFTKMHGLGNDYLFVVGEVPKNAAALSKRLSERHFGAGADGMIYITKAEDADFGMRIFNSDGSEAAMCGNGIRCLGKLVYDKHLTMKTALRIRTPSGVRELTLHPEGGRVSLVSVEMGAAEVRPETTVMLDGIPVSLTPVSIGNPHAVIFTGNAEQAPLVTMGARICRHEAFAGGVNVEFAQILSENSIRMRVWERGSGVTLACGTGASAVSAAAVKRGLCKENSPIAVHLDGGTLHVLVKPDGKITLTGPAVTVFEGETADI